MRFSYESLPSRVVFGRGVAPGSIAAEVDALGLRSLILLTSHADAVVDAIRHALGSRVVTEFTDPRPHVPAELADELRAQAARFPLDGIVAVGGGSTVGAAKILALTSGLPIVAVPTTFAGSEVTPIWGMTTDGVKRTGRDPRVLPRVVLYDADLLDGLPDGLAVASTLNALAHCIDALWAPGANPVSAAVAAEGIRALRGGLLAFAGDGGRDADAHGLLQYGSFLAGTAFAVTGSGLHHKLCHALGGAFDLPHAELHAVMLPVVLAFNAVAAPEAVVRIADAMQTDDPLAELRRLVALAGAPRTLLELGLTSADRPRAAEVVRSVLPIPNPRPVDRDAVELLLAEAFGGAA